MKKVVFTLVICIGCIGKNKSIQPVTKPLREAVYASGYVVSKNEYQIFSQVDGYVVDILVKEGEAVKKDQPIFIIESRQQSARYSISRESYNLLAKNNREDSPALMEAKALVASAQSKWQFDSVNFVRYSNLWKDNAITQNEFDRAKLTFDNSKNDLLLQKSRLSKLRDQLKLDLRNAENNLKIAAEESGRYTVRSDVDGQVYKTLKERGELVRRSEALATVGSGSQFYLQLNVDELDIEKVKTGQRVMAKIDAFGGKIFNGLVYKVYPMVDERAQSIRVDADFSDPFLNGFSGLAVEANILIRQKEKALVIPKSFVLPGDSVLIRTNEGKRKVKIVRGIETLDEVEITQGITKDTNVILN